MSRAAVIWTWVNPNSRRRCAIRAPNALQNAFSCGDSLDPVFLLDGIAQLSLEAILLDVLDCAIFVGNLNTGPFHPDLWSAKRHCKTGIATNRLREIERQPKQKRLGIPN